VKENPKKTFEEKGNSMKPPREIRTPTKRIMVG
jgi:hypothetical protein